MVDRIDKIENKVDILDSSLKVFHSDMKQINTSLDRITAAIDKIVELQIDQRVFKEQCENRHNNLKDNDKILFSRTQQLSEKLDASAIDHSRVDRLDSILWGIIKWGSLVGGSAIVSTVIYVANHGGIR
jgi:hypothetical protein